jgi:membrane protease YdiL (CAAX protease family)
VITNEPSPLQNETSLDPAILPEHKYPAPQIVVTTQENAWWELGKAILAWVASVALLLFVPLLIILPYFLSLFANSGALTAEALSQDKTFLLLSIVGVIPAHALTLVAVWALVTRWGRKPFWQTLRFSWPPGVSPWLGVVFCALIAVVLLVAGYVITIFLGGGKTDLDRLIESSYQARLATAFLAVATAPLVEEIIYRGMLYPALQRVIGMGGAIAVVSIMFAGVHVLQYRNNIGVIAVITLLSVSLTVVRALSDRLLPSVIIHLVFNGLQSLYLILQPLIEKTQKVEPAPALICRALHHLF